LPIHHKTLNSLRSIDVLERLDKLRWPQPEGSSSSERIWAHFLIFFEWSLPLLSCEWLS
jgi:hypothetical protein